MVLHHARTKPRLPVIHGATARDHDTARLVSAYERTLANGNAHGLGGGGPAPRRSIEMQIGPAHARGLDFENNLIVTGFGILKARQLDAAITDKDHTLHRRTPPLLTSLSRLHLAQVCQQRKQPNGRVDRLRQAKIE